MHAFYLLNIGFKKRISHFFFFFFLLQISKTYWMDNQPDDYEGIEDCVAFRNLRSNIAKWNDVRCSTRYKFVCEVFPGKLRNILGYRV